MRRRETPLASFMKTVTPGDQHSRGTIMAWIREHGQYRLIDLTYHITANGIRLPILAGPDLRCWDGHHRVTAAFDLGLETIPNPYAKETT